MLKHREIYDAVGGRATLERVHKRFYDDLYADPWLGQFFGEVAQEEIEAQQTDFMSSIMGGPKSFVGQSPQAAHRHMLITTEMLELRTEFLDRALRAEGIPEAARLAWLDLDASFRNAIAKQRIEECVQRYTFEPILVAHRPLRDAG